MVTGPRPIPPATTWPTAANPSPPLTTLRTAVTVTAVPAAGAPIPVRTICELLPGRVAPVDRPDVEREDGVHVRGGEQGLRQGDGDVVAVGVLVSDLAGPNEGGRGVAVFQRLDTDAGRRRAGCAWLMIIAWLMGLVERSVLLADHFAAVPAEQGREHHGGRRLAEKPTEPSPRTDITPARVEAVRVPGIGAVHHAAAADVVARWRSGPPRTGRSDCPRIPIRRLPLRTPY